MKIDIRTEQPEITEILFADGVEGAASSFKLHGADHVTFYDNQVQFSDSVDIVDIPNLIKALEKAYELWR